LDKLTAAVIQRSECCKMIIKACQLQPIRW